MDERERDSTEILREEPRRGKFTVWPYQVGIVMRSGEVVDIFSEGERRLPRGEVRTYVASTAPFHLTFWLKDPGDATQPSEGVALEQPVLTADGQLVTGRIDLTLTVVPKQVEYLLQLLGPRGAISEQEVADAIKYELLAKVLALDLHRHTSSDLRGNRDLFKGIYESLQVELTSTIRRYALRLDNFYVNWGLTPEEQERIKEQRHQSIIRDIEREEELEELGGVQTDDSADSPEQPEEQPQPQSGRASRVAVGVVIVGALAAIGLAAIGFAGFTILNSDDSPQQATPPPAAAALPTETPAPAADPPPTNEPTRTAALPTETPVPAAAPPPTNEPTRAVAPPTDTPTSEATPETVPAAARPTALPTMTSTATPVPTPQDTPTATHTPMPVPTATPVPPPQDTPTATHTPTNTPVPTAVPTSTPISGKQAGTLLRTITVGGRVLSSPAVLGGTMYVGSDDGHLYAVDIASQRELWRFATGARIASSPAVSNGVVYVGSNDLHLYAIDAANGTLRWKHETGAEVFSSPAVSNGIVYVGSDDNHLYAFDATNGTLRWQYETEDWVSTDPAVGGSAVYVRSQDGILHAVDASTGEGLWQYNTSGQGVSASPAFADGVVYTGGNRTHALDASSGEVVWLYQTEYRAEAPFYSPAYSPTVADGIVYFGSADGHLYAIDASTQALLWLYDGIQPTDAAPMVVDGAVYVQSEDGHLYALDEFTGRLLWRSEMGGVSGAPRSYGGVVYTAANVGKVYGMVASSPLATAAPAQEQEAGDLLWRYRAGGFSISPPAVASGLLYFGARDGYLYAIDRTTGVLIWRYQLGGWVRSPMVTDDTVYVMVWTEENGTQVYALHATNGELQWIYDREDVRSLVVSRGVVYTSNGDGSVRALDALTGSLIWRYRPDGNPDGNWGSSPMVVVTEDAVYVGSGDTESGEGYVYALDAVTGSLRWRYSTGPGNVIPSIIVMDSIVYVTSTTRVGGASWGYWSYRPSVLALNALSGEVLWSYDYSSSDAGSPLKVADGILYVIRKDHSIIAFDASTGTEMWSTNSDSLPLIGDGVVYVPYAYAQNDVVGITHRGLDPATGESLWTSETERPWSHEQDIDRTGEGIIDDGIVYSTVARSVYALHASTGEVLWTYDFGAHEGSLSRTTTDAGVLYAAGNLSIYAFVAPGLTWVEPTPTPTPTSTPNPLQQGR